MKKIKKITAILLSVLIYSLFIYDITNKTYSEEMFSETSENDVINNENDDAEIPVINDISEENIPQVQKDAIEENINNDNVILSSDIETSDNADSEPETEDETVIDEVLSSDSEENDELTDEEIQDAIIAERRKQHDEEIRQIIENDPGVIYNSDVTSNSYENDALQENGTSNEETLDTEEFEDALMCEQFTGNGTDWVLTSLGDNEANWLINECNKIVGEILTDNMSDLEKYWTLADWIADNIDYAHSELSSPNYSSISGDPVKSPHGPYYTLKQRRGVCQGQTYLYLCLCHAADLSCDAISYNPNHILNYIPNINDNDYLVDVTSHEFGMCLRTNVNPTSTYADHIYYLTCPGSFDCTNNCFNRQEKDSRYSEPLFRPFYIVKDQIVKVSIPMLDGTYQPYEYKEEDNYQAFLDFIEENAGYGSIDPYIERGSGTSGIHYSHYEDYACQVPFNTGNWVYDDFIAGSLQRKSTWGETSLKSVDKSGLKESYFCETDDEYIEAVMNDLVLSVEGYDKSAKEIKKHKTILTPNVDYTATKFQKSLSGHWENNKYILELTGTVTLKGINDYSGTTGVKIKIAKDTKTYDITIIAGGTDKSVCDKLNVSCSVRNSAPGVASVSPYGEVTGLKAGKTTAVLTSDYVDYTLNITVVTPQFDIKTYNKNVGDVFDIGFNSVGYDATYKSDKPSICSIDENGTATALGSGTAKITATVEGKAYTTTVNVFNPVLSGVSDMYLDGKTSTFKITGGNGITTWTSSNPNILTITNKGVVKGITAGTAKITAVNNGKSMTKEVVVHRVPRMIKSAFTLNLGETLTIDDAVFDPVDIDASKISYQLARTNVATLSGNVLTPLKTGSCSVTVNADGKKFTLKATIYDPSLVAPDVVYLNNRTVTLKIKSGDKITTWNTSDPDVLSITNKGVVKGISNGYATVTAVNNGRTMTKEIYVCPSPKFNVKTTILNADKVLPIDDALYDDAGIGNTVFKSSNDKIAYIQGNKLIPVKAGTVTLTAITDNRKYITKVTIYNPTLTAPNVVYLNNRTVTLKITSGYKDTVWSVDKPEILSITNKGVVKGASNGYATVTAINNGRTMTKTIYVCNFPKFNVKGAEIKTSETLSLDSALFDDAGIGNAVFKSNNAKIAYIDGNRLVPVKAGTITLTATVDGKNYSIRVKITNP